MSRSAFPWAETADTSRGDDGMTLREYEVIQYRAAALTGLLAAVGMDEEVNNEVARLEGITVHALIAGGAERYAQAMYAAAHPEADE